MKEHFGAHPDAEIYQSQPGMAAVPGARVLAEFGDDPYRYESAKARKNYAGTSPITRASGKQKVVAARFVRNKRLIDALMAWAFTSMLASPGARAFYDEQRAKGLEHNDALRRLANLLSASCTDASIAAPSMTRTRPGSTQKNSSTSLTKLDLGCLSRAPAASLRDWLRRLLDRTRLPSGSAAIGFGGGACDRPGRGPVAVRDGEGHLGT